MWYNTLLRTTKCAKDVVKITVKFVIGMIVVWLTLKKDFYDFMNLTLEIFLES